ncbi:hypothetical protein PR048_018075 [Dryococelus australis]|uniref:Uncharacterized protein n=1 Tax=Dryococelus australis TaxID=614101 RepID=A0ABQ9HBG1_9NEOP|nr:hypothetical protein PR048_018075 [Dryococelus australis]
MSAPSETNLWIRHWYSRSSEEMSPDTAMLLAEAAGVSSYPSSLVMSNQITGIVKMFVVHVWCVLWEADNAVGMLSRARLQSHFERGSAWVLEDSVVQIMAVLKPAVYSKRQSKLQRQNKSARKTGNIRENPPTSCIVRHDYHLRKSGNGPAGDLSRIALVGGEQANRSATAAPGSFEFSALQTTAFYLWLLVILLASHQGKPGSIPGRVTPGLSLVGIVPDDAAGRQVFSGISRFPQNFIPTLLHSNLASPSSALKTSPPLFTHLFNTRIDPYSHVAPELLDLAHAKYIQPDGDLPGVIFAYVVFRTCYHAVHASQVQPTASADYRPETARTESENCDWGRSFVWVDGRQRTFLIASRVATIAAKSGFCRNAYSELNFADVSSDALTSFQAARGRAYNLRNSREHTGGSRRCLLSAVHTRRTQQKPVTRVEPGETECIAVTHERAVRHQLYKCCIAQSRTQVTLQQFTIRRWSRITSVSEATGTERLVCSPPTNANRVQFSAGSLPDFRMWDSSQTTPLVNGFSCGSPDSPNLSFRRCSILTSITLIGCQDFALVGQRFAPGRGAPALTDLNFRDAVIHSTGHGKSVGLFFRRGFALSVPAAPRKHLKVERPRWCSGHTTRLPPKRTRFEFLCGVVPGFSHVWESCRMWPLLGEFTRGSPVSRPLHSGAAPHSPHFIRIGSQDLDGRPQLLSDKGNTVTRINCTIATKPEAQNWRAVFSSSMGLSAYYFAGGNLCSKKTGNWLAGEQTNLQALTSTCCTTIVQLFSFPGRTSPTLAELPRPMLQRLYPAILGPQLTNHWRILFATHQWFSISDQHLAQLRSAISTAYVRFVAITGSFQFTAELSANGWFSWYGISFTVCCESTFVLSPTVPRPEEFIRALLGYRDWFCGASMITLPHIHSTMTEVKQPLIRLDHAAPSRKMAALTTNMSLLRLPISYCLRFLFQSLTCLGPAVAERLACLPPTKENRVKSPVGSLPDFHMWDSCQTMLVVVGFSRGSPISPTLSFRRCSIPTSIPLIGSQDLAVKRRPNLFTHSNVYIYLMFEKVKSKHEAYLTTAHEPPLPIMLFFAWLVWSEQIHDPPSFLHNKHQALFLEVNMFSECGTDNVTSSVQWRLLRRIGFDSWRVAPEFSHVGIGRTMPLVGGFSRISPITPFCNAAPCPPRSTLICAQELDLRNIPFCLGAAGWRVSYQELSGERRSVCAGDRDMSGYSTPLYLPRSPSTKVNRAQSQAGSPDFHKWKSRWTMPLVGGYSQGSPASPALSLRCRSILSSITHIGSQDLAVKGRPNLFTHFTHKLPPPPSQMPLLQDPRATNQTIMGSPTTANNVKYRRNLGGQYAAELVAVQDRPYTSCHEPGLGLIWRADSHLCKPCDIKGFPYTGAPRLLTSYLGEAGSNPGGVAPRFTHVSNVPKDAARQRVFSGIPRSPHRCIPAPLHTHPASPSSALEISMDNFANSFQDKIDFKQMYTEVIFAIGLQFIRHALDDSEPLAHLQGNKWRVSYCQAWSNTGYSLEKQPMNKHLRLECSQGSELSPFMAVPRFQLTLVTIRHEALSRLCCNSIPPATTRGRGTMLPPEGDPGRKDGWKAAEIYVDARTRFRFLSLPGLSVQLGYAFTNRKEENEKRQLSGSGVYFFKCQAMPGPRTTGCSVLLIPVRCGAGEKAIRVRFPAGSPSGFSHVGIVPDDASGRLFYSGIFRSSLSFILALLHPPHTSPSSALKTSMLRAAQIPSVTHSFAHSSTFSSRVHDREREWFCDTTKLIRVNLTKALCGMGTAVAERLARSPPTKANRVQSPPGFLQVGIVPDDAVGRRVFSGISRSPRPFIPVPLHIHFNHSHRLSIPRC